MANLTSALQQLRAERKQAQAHVEKLDQAISVIESLSSGTFRQANQPGRIISAASRRKMRLAQQARRAKESGQAATTPKRTMSASARRKIAAAKKAWWAAKRKAGRKAA